MAKRPISGEEINRLIDESRQSCKRTLANLDTEERLLQSRLRDPDQRDIVTDIYNQLRALTEEFDQLALDPFAGFDPRMLTGHPDQVLAEIKRSCRSNMQKAIRLRRELFLLRGGGLSH
jgi:hypothetical protein